MQLESLYINKLRNISDQNVDPGSQFNEFLGDNAQGKTSYLEAISLCIVGSSFRTSHLKDLIAHGEEGLFLEAIVVVDGIRTTLCLHYNGEERQVSINGVRQTSSASLLGNLLGVTCGPHDNEVIAGPPIVRRKFLDQQIAQIDPFYVEQLRRYNRALTHRNRLLKTKDVRGIKAFEEQLARAGSYITEARRTTVDSLRPLVTFFYGELFGSSDQELSIDYCSQAPQNDLFQWHMDQYERRRDREMKLMMTLVGPHRDDLSLFLGGHSGRVVGSLGQIRAISLSLRLAEWNLLKNRSGQSPLFILDDIESCFDQARRTLLVDMLQKCGQVFISSCSSVIQSSKKFKVDRGAIVNLE